MMGLLSEMGLGQREHIALVGGGGKTSLCFAMAGDLLQAGKRVITSTTTKVRQMEAKQAPEVVFLPSGPPPYQGLEERLDRVGHIFVARGPAEPGKVGGISRAVADDLFDRMKVDYLIVEADGAAGLPLKAPAPHEPVIPHSVTLVVAVAGLEALGRPLDPGTVFRPEIFGKITGLEQGQTVTPEVLCRVFLSPDGLFKGSPEGARRIVFLNKLDLLPSREGARDLARMLLDFSRGGVERVVAGSLMKNEYFAVKRVK